MRLGPSEPVLRALDAIHLPLFTGTGGISANGTGLHTVRLFTNSTSDNLDVWSRTSTCTGRRSTLEIQRRSGH